MPSDGSVTKWIDQLQVGDAVAVRQLWERYFHRLVSLARKKLADAPRGMADEEDVALSAFDSFCRQAEQGRFPDLADRDGLWRLLVVMTARKVSHLVRDESRQKRGGEGAAEDNEGDLCGHGTACAGVIRSMAPEAELYSVRVLGAGFTGSGKVLLAGLKWAVEQGYDVINMSLSTTKRQLAEVLHELADTAYFKRTVLVAAAHNMPVESFPWRFSSVISVGSHEEDDPLTFFANPDPPVEFFARGVNVDIAWLGGSTIRATGNSFATPCIAGISALVLSKHPRLTPFQLKSVLYLISSNVGGGP